MSKYTGLGHDFLLAVYAFFVYILLGELSFLFIFGGETTFSAFWLPAGFGVAVFLLTETRIWPLLLLSVFTAGFVLNWSENHPLEICLTWAIANSIDPILGAWLLRHFIEAPLTLVSLRDVIALIVLSAMISTTPGATLAALIAHVWFRDHPFHVNWFAWWFSDILGVMVVAPFILIWFGKRAFCATRPGYWVEGAILCTVIFGLTEWTFDREGTGSNKLFSIIIVSFLLNSWAVLRFEARGAVTASLIFNFIAAYHTARGRGPFALLATSPYERLISLQSFLLFNSFSWLTIAALLTEKETALRELTLVKQHLDSRVQQRTSELSQANAYLNSLFDHIPNMIFLKEAQHLRFVRFNRAGEELLGYSSQELLGKNDFDFFPKSEAEYFMAKDREVLSSHKLLDIPIEPIHTRNKGTRLLHTKKIPMYDPDGYPLYLLGISEDITDKLKAEENQLMLIREHQARNEAERSIKMRDDFLALASHELRTPLTPLKLNLQLIRRSLENFDSSIYSTVEPLVKSLDKTYYQFEQFCFLVEDILDVSRLSLDRLVLTRQEVNLSEKLGKLLVQLEPEFRRGDCALIVSLEPEIRGMLDSFRIEQVIRNILENAIKYGKGKPIEVSLSRIGNNAKFTVQDHGIGITLDDQKKIFKRYERVAPLEHFGGLGLGLYMAREIIKAHGGTIRVESIPHEGATFTVEVPL